MMDYAGTAMQTQQQGLSKTEIPALGQIKSAAERIAKSRSNIECFLERFNGGGPDCVGSGTDERTSSYRNDLQSLFEQVERLEMIVSQLGTIG